MESVSDPNKPVSKNKKRRDAKKAKEMEANQGSAQTYQPQAAFEPASSGASQPSTGDPEKDKKIRNLRKKLQQIEKLKEQQKAGKKLEKNQEDKLKTEDALIKELEDLELS